MILAVVVFAFLAFVATWLLESRGVFSHARLAVHGARVAPLAESAKVSEPIAFMGPIFDEMGKAVSLKSKFVGKVVGDSMAPRMPNGATFLADKIVTEIERKSIRAGDIVVVNGPTRLSETGRRLRVVAAVHGSQVSFRPDRQGKGHSTRSIDQIEALVTHVLET